MVARVLWEDLVRVRIPALRQIKIFLPAHKFVYRCSSLLLMIKTLGCFKHRGIGKIRRDFLFETSAHLVAQADIAD